MAKRKTEETEKQTSFELRDVDDLIPYARNARTHTPEQVNKLAGSIKEFGFLNPVVISEDGGILAGHGRVLAAKKLGLKQVPCVVESHLSDIQKKAYILADNRLALDAGWDEEMLKVELSELDAADFEMNLLGFGGEELSRYLEDDGIRIGDDSEPEGEEPEEETEIEVNENAETVTEPGDIWLLGEHRLICGDCTDANVVKRLIGDRNPQLMVTDPPYGVNYDPTKRVGYINGIIGAGFKIDCDKDARGKVENDDRCSWREAYSLFGGNVAYVWHPSSHTDVFMADLKACGFKISSVIVWNKSQMVFGRTDYHWKHESCLYCTKEGRKWTGERDKNTVWDIPSIRGLRKEEGTWGHSTQKPIECMKRPIENNSDPGDWVYDPFSGSGTTLIAAEKTGRKCLACEISPVYCDAIIRRWESVTGEKAVLEGDGSLFDELAELAEDSGEGLIE